MVGNVIAQCELLLTSIFQFLGPQKIWSVYMAAILNFSKTLTKPQCDSKIWIISDLNLESTSGGHL